MIQKKNCYLRCWRKSCFLKAFTLDKNNIDVDISTDLILGFYKVADDHPLLSVVSEDDIALLALRLKEETLINHLSSDLEMAEVLMKYPPVKKSQSGCNNLRPSLRLFYDGSFERDGK